MSRQIKDEATGEMLDGIQDNDPTCRSLTSLQQRLFRMGGRLIRHARYFTLHLAESYLTESLFRQILQRIDRPV